MVVNQADREVVALICLAAMENSPRDRQDRNCVRATVLRERTRYCHYVALFPLRHETADPTIPTAPEDEQTDHVSKHGETTPRFAKVADDCRDDGNDRSASIAPFWPHADHFRSSTL